jgi:hypothetical protein
MLITIPARYRGQWRNLNLCRVVPSVSDSVFSSITTFLISVLLSSICLATAFISVVILHPKAGVADSASPEAAALVRRAIDYWRDKTSYTEIEMQIHRPDFDRSTKLTGWTSGSDQSLVRFTYPSKDAGNATLSIGDEIWSFSPKTGRVIRIPPSMKAQSWMGSDFSYQDLARTDDIVDQYSHTITGTGIDDGKKTYSVQSIPKPDAPVVWGKEELVIREDDIILSHRFFDQDGNLVKELKTTEIKLMGGKLYPKKMRMTKVSSDRGAVATKDEWTEINHTLVDFGRPVAPNFFTVQNLQSR